MSSAHLDVYLQMVGRSEQHTGHQVRVAPQLLDTLLGDGTEHLHIVTRSAEEEPADTKHHLSALMAGFVVIIVVTRIFFGVLWVKFRSNADFIVIILE